MRSCREAHRKRWSFGGEGGCKALCKGGPKPNRRGETVHQESIARSRPGSPSGERTRSGFLGCPLLAGGKFPPAAGLHIGHLDAPSLVQHSERFSAGDREQSRGSDQS